MTETSQKDQYQSSRLGHSQPDEHRRLRLLECALDPETVRILSGIGLTPTWRCLDFGAGAGSITRFLAGHCAEVTATDTDTRFLDRLELTNVKVLMHDAVSDDFPSANFDLVHARCVLEHLADREAVLTKAASWVAPGGWLVLTVSSALTASASPHAVIQRLTAAFLNHLGSTVGTDFGWAPQLPVLLKKAGLSDVDMSVLPQVMHGGTNEDVVITTLQNLMPAFVREGLLTASEASEASALFADASYVDLGGCFVSAWGQKPATG